MLGNKRKFNTNHKQHMIDGNEVFKAEFSESSEEGSEGTYSIYI